MIYSSVRRGCVFLVLAALVLFSFQNSVLAEGLAFQHTGTIRVTKPDGGVLVIEPGQALSDIPSGSRVEVLNGSIEIEPAEGFIQLVLGGSVATVKAGDKVSAAIDQKTATAVFKVKTGQLNIISGNTTTTLSAYQQAQVSFDKVTGITTVESIIGTIETVTVGVKAMISQGAMAQIRTDVKTRNVHIDCVKGTIEAVTTDGRIIELKEGEPMDAPGSAEGEIQAFAGGESRFEPVEEPAEPERPEASPHRP